MSYCLNPDCQKPQNPSDAKFCQNCGAKLLLGERYRATEPLGTGGFGRTFLGVDYFKPSQPRCAIKQFFPQDRGFVTSVKAKELFNREAVRLDVLGKHPQIPELLAHFEQDEHHYLVQEFIEGRNLAQELADEGPFNETKIRHLLSDLLPVLQFVHSHQVIHRDIKPQNIIRRRTPTPQTPGNLAIVDFGAAKFLDTASLERTATLIGSPAYTAPEQLMGKAIFASDIYSLGVTCTHLLTQVSPFDLFDSRQGTWVWRDYLRQLISPQLADILDKMLETAINRRYLSAAQVLKALNAQPVKARTAPVAHPPAPTAPQPPPAPVPVAPAAPQPAPPQTPNLPSPPIAHRLAEIQKALQDALTPYSLKVQVNLAKTHLTIVINRAENTPVNYARVSRIVATQLTALRLTGVRQIKAFGRIKNQSAPEWQKRFKITPLPENSSALVPAAKKIQAGRQKLLQLKNKTLWEDAIMFLMALFLFNKIVLYSPVCALAVSSGFLIVKEAVGHYKEIRTDQLFRELGIASALVGVLNVKMVVTDVFGILWACLFVALPFLYVKNNFGGE
ncbi:serine/threonine-protein kinase [Kamptonema formosum]|uniref:serine/threonine-protein kinase n=1 Tax=Kamptonema formosum TaxID=331992 RepID=UPI00037109C8|nr:serine/threonine-protein kinase [Oscillatoria sp. PCC 10802]